ncbi:hypothetical protein N7460_002513 [Penicillium canescens]|uniref:non-specific serine/threonine protein kinase n=1 Tax=Penicillium canescens TaxID=5083 RepID=A0AAD6IKX3_PENCN|nr:hypothetical protein N7460_002513 [Penicillium canescens]KAJ6065744.1 hypothetical protein N7444_001397 [Penicillium canescens]
MFKKLLMLSPRKKKAKDQTHTSGSSSTGPSTPSAPSAPILAASTFSAPPDPNLPNPNSAVANDSPEVVEPKLGVLAVSLYQAQCISLPRDADLPKGVMPYALIDYDKTQVFINSVSGTSSEPLWAGRANQFMFDVWKSTQLTVHLFVRSSSYSPAVGRSKDICVGTAHVIPPINKQGMKNGDEFISWLDFDEGPGQLKIGFQYAETMDEKLTVSDFTLLKVIGQGSFGKVLQVRKNDTQRVYAMKSVRKAKIISRNEVLHTMTERSVLAQVNNAFIVPLKFSFQSETKLYFVLAFVNGGELFTHLNDAKAFDINRARFYTAELLCALECLHDFGVIYRDLKPENILLDYEGHIALCDFGLCKLAMRDEDKTDTFCGTPEYMAPEVITNSPYNKTVDWWTLGVLLYEMLTGLPPFYDEDKDEMYRKIFSTAVIAPAAKSLLQGLLHRGPAQRLGANGAGEIKAHPFFKGIDWHKLAQRRYVPAFKPNVTGINDTGAIDQQWTGQSPRDSVPSGPALCRAQQQQFAGFSFTRAGSSPHAEGSRVAGSQNQE